MQRRPRQRQGQAGFTLVELLVVVVILGILSAVVVFAVRGVGDKGQGAAVATDERIIRTAQEAHCAQFGRYATGQQLANAPAKLLSDEPKLHTVTAGDGFPEGNCPTSPKNYKIECKDGSVMPNCGVPGNVPPPCAAVDGFFCRVEPDPPALGHMVQLTTGPNAGKIFLEGYAGGQRDANGYPTTASALYDPQGPGLGTWTQGPPAPKFPSPLQPSIVTSNPVELTGTPAQCGSNCGKVLVPLLGAVTGGSGWQLVDPANFPNLTWENAGPPGGEPGPRVAVPLKTGKVLTYAQSGLFKRYDPAVTDTAQSFTPTLGDVPDSTRGPALVPLNDAAGRVLVVGRDRNFQPFVKLYDPGSNSFSTRSTPEPRPNPLFGEREFRNGDVVLLPDGRVLALKFERGDIYDVANDTWSQASTCTPPTLETVCVILGVAGDKLLAYTSTDGERSDGRVWLFDPAKPNDQAWTQTAGAPNDPASIGYAVFVKGGCANCNRLLTAGPRRQQGPVSGDSLRAELYKPKLGSTPPTTLPTVPVP